MLHTAFDAQLWVAFHVLLDRSGERSHNISMLDKRAIIRMHAYLDLVDCPAALSAEKASCSLSMASLPGKHSILFDTKVFQLASLASKAQRGPACVESHLPRGFYWGFYSRPEARIDLWASCLHGMHRSDEQ